MAGLAVEVMVAGLEEVGTVEVATGAAKVVAALVAERAVVEMEVVATAEAATVVVKCGGEGGGVKSQVGVNS